MKNIGKYNLVNVEIITELKSQFQLFTFQQLTNIIYLIINNICKDMINIFSTLINLFCTLNYLM